MTLTDRTVSSVLTFLVRTLLCPKVYFVDENQKEAYSDKPVIFVCNHTGHLDGGILNVCFHKNVIRSLAAKDRFEQKWFGFLLRHTQCIPIDRQNADTTWIHSAIKALKADGQCVAIYPEGRHGEHRKQLPFHSGVSMLAIMAGVPIVMVYIDGPARLFHRTGVLVDREMKIDIPQGGLSADFVNDQTLKLQERMKWLTQEYIKKGDC